MGRGSGFMSVGIGLGDVDGDDAEDGRSARGFALDGKGSAQDADAVLHDAEAEAGRLGAACRDALAVVTDEESELVDRA